MDIIVIVTSIGIIILGIYAIIKLFSEKGRVNCPKCKRPTRHRLLNRRSTGKQFLYKTSYQCCSCGYKWENIEEDDAGEY